MRVIYELANSEEEIIETYWNVKEENKIILENRSREIIETYWNVKEYQPNPPRMSWQK